MHTGLSVSSLWYRSHRGLYWKDCSFISSLTSLVVGHLSNQVLPSESVMQAAKDYLWSLLFCSQLCFFFCCCQFLLPSLVPRSLGQVNQENFLLLKVVSRGSCSCIDLVMQSYKWWTRHPGWPQEATGSLLALFVMDGYMGVAFLQFQVVRGSDYLCYFLS